MEVLMGAEGFEDGYVLIVFGSYTFKKTPTLHKTREGWGTQP